MLGGRGWAQPALLDGYDITTIACFFGWGDNDGAWDLRMPRAVCNASLMICPPPCP